MNGRRRKRRGRCAGGSRRGEDNCGKDLETLMKDTDRDHWMTAQEALDYGIVDKILVSKKA